ncbi:MAG: hypothetical protein E7280_04190 [Lachnospiraceae bacterium]|nr:hypothetical protein [Lachnospiraceae bacterium]
MNNSSEMLNGVRVLNQTVSKCPYGNASDYSYKMGTGAKASIKLDKAISQITSVAFEFIVVAELGIPGLIVDAYDLAYAGLSAYSPQTKGISCKWTNYSHKKYKDTYIKPIDMYVYKTMYKWYSELNYKGVEIPETCYQTKQFLQ